MKKFIGIMILIAIILTVGYIETHYTIDQAIVYKIEDDNVFIKDCFGDCWIIDNTNNFVIGDTVKLYMHNNTTTDNRDDEIESYKKLSI